MKPFNFTLSEALDLTIDIINMHGIPVGFRGSGIYTAMQKYEEQVGDINAE